MTYGGGKYGDNKYRDVSHNRVWVALLMTTMGDSQHKMLNQRRASSVNSATCHAYVSLQNEILNQEWRSDMIMDKKTYHKGRYGDNKYRDVSHNRVWVTLLMTAMSDTHHRMLSQR